MSTKPPEFSLFVGDDTISREQARHNRIEQITSFHPATTQQRFDPSAESITSYLERVITPSLFGDIRIFLLPHAEELSEQELAELGITCKYPVDDAYVIIEAEKVKAEGKGETKTGKRFDAFCKAFGKLADKNPQQYSNEKFIKPRDYEMAAWIVDRLPGLFNRTISKKDAEYLLDLVGYDLDTIYSELQKMDIHLPPGDPVNKETIDYITGASRAVSPFELAQAAGKKDLPRTLELIDALFAQTAYVPMCINALFKHFFALLRINEYARKNPQAIKRFLAASGFSGRQVRDEIGLAIGMAGGLLGPMDQKRIYPVIVLSGIIAQARSFSHKNLLTIMNILGEFDVGLKTGKIPDDKASLTLLCYKIVRSTELQPETV